MGTLEDSSLFNEEAQLEPSLLEPEIGHVTLKDLIRDHPNLYLIPSRAFSDLAFLC